MGGLAHALGKQGSGRLARLLGFRWSFDTSWGVGIICVVGARDKETEGALRVGKVFFILVLTYDNSFRGRCLLVYWIMMGIFLWF